LSPTLFNIGIDPLLRRLNENYQDFGYKYGRNKSIVALAYADDLLIFADSKENLDNVLRATDYFIKYAKITFNPDKCRIIVNNLSHHIISDTFLPDKQRQLIQVQVCQTDGQLSI
jgi:hypothetical protein